MGVIAFTLLAHEFPFNGNSLPELSNNIMKTMPDYNKLSEKGISNDCIDLIKNMMKKQSNKRYSIDDVLNHRFILQEVEKIKKKLTLTKDDKENAL